MQNKEIYQILNDFGIKHYQTFNNMFAKVENESEEINGNLVLVTAMTSNKTGIGKTTVSIGLADALNLCGKKTMLALREPSMGPVFGIKGGATGGGESQIVPSDEINLHFTGDFHAVAQANNLLASIIDNHIFQGNELEIEEIFLKRCLDVNDRSLREISYKIKEKEFKTGFEITAASEVMAIVCLSENLTELKKNLGDILIGLTKNGTPVFARDLKAEESMTVLLKDAFKPNAVKTKKGTLALVHMGPFANIAHGCNSLVATKFALSHANYVVTEAGFGSDLGGEKFLDIVARKIDIKPCVVVLVISLKVIKEHGCGDLKIGIENVKKHITNLKCVFKVNVVVAINKHKDDVENEIEIVKTLCECKTVICQAYDMGAEGCLDLAKEVIKFEKCPKNIEFVYDLTDSIKEKIEKVACKVYGAKQVLYSPIANEKISLAEKLGFSNFFINIAKTQFSLSDDKNLLASPQNFDFHISDIQIRAGAKMIVAIAGDMLLMPGLSKHSNYENIKIDEKGIVCGIF